MWTALKNGGEVAIAYAMSCLGLTEPKLSVRTIYDRGRQNMSLVKI
jgi:hypothetical protein